jgi:putative aldouronate transport system substrate-binding protein
MELRGMMSAERGYEFKYPVTEERQPINVEQVANEHPQATEPKELWKYDYPDELQGMGSFNNFFTHNSRMFGFNGIPVSVLNADLKSMAEAYRTGDESILNSNSRTMWDQWNATTPNMVKNWAKTEKYWSVFEKSGDYVADVYAGAPTELMAEKQAYLNKLELEAFTRIIMGTKPISEFDVFVENWNSNGGAEIVAEVNEWHRANQ